MKCRNLVWQAERILYRTPMTVAEISEKLGTSVNYIREYFGQSERIKVVGQRRQSRRGKYAFVYGSTGYSAKPTKASNDHPQNRRRTRSKPGEVSRSGASDGRTGDIPSSPDMGRGERADNRESSVARRPGQSRGFNHALKWCGKVGPSDLTAAQFAMTMRRKLCHTEEVSICLTVFEFDGNLYASPRKNAIHDYIGEQNIIGPAQVIGTYTATTPLETMADDWREHRRMAA